MKLLAKESIEVKKNINDVFSYVINMKNYSKWFPEVRPFRSEDSRNDRVVGKKYLETINIPFKGENEYIIEVREYEENVKFVTEGEVPPLLPRMTINFTKISETESLVKWKMESRSKNLLFNFIFLPGIKNKMRIQAKQGMLNLKYILEKKNY